MICYAKHGIGLYIGVTEQPLYDPGSKETKPRSTRDGRPVECVETGERYRSINAAAKATAGEHSIKNAANGIARACRTGGRSYGRHWRFIGKLGGDTDA